MRILHVAMGMPEFDRAMSAAGHTVHRVAWREWMKGPNPHTVRRLGAEIIRRAKSFDPHIVFCQLQTPGVMEADTIAALREQGAVVMNWTGDVRDELGWYADIGHAFNVSLFTNGTDIDGMRALGLPADHLQIGYDERIYRQSDTPQKRHGVVFLGNNYRGRFPESDQRAALVARLKQTFRNRFTLYGNGWGHGTVVSTPTVEVNAYQRAVVAVNWDHYIRPLFASDRILRAQACGCPVVSQRYIGIEADHPHAAGADDIDHAVELVALRLETPTISEEVGRMAAEHTLARHTWHSRVADIERLYETYR